MSGFVRPCLLLLLTKGPSHGYELLDGLGSLGFEASPPDPAAVYKNRRRLEADALVRSEWETSGSGPAKRIYHLTREGEDVLQAWVVSLRQYSQAIEKFIEIFHRQVGR